MLPLEEPATPNPLQAQFLIGGLCSTAGRNPFPLIIFGRVCTEKRTIWPAKLKLGAPRGVCNAENVPHWISD
jgi:hypothetical protein